MASTVVRLGDVAEIISADRADARRLAALPLMPAPPIGSERFLRKREVEDLLAAHGQNLSELRFEGAVQVAISTSTVNADVSGTTQTVDRYKPMNLHAAILAAPSGGVGAVSDNDARDNEVRDELHRAILRYLSSATGRADSWQVSCDLTAAQLTQLRGATSPLECQGGRAPWIGRQRFVVSFTTPQGAVRLPIGADVNGGVTQVVVALGPIARGAVITAADVELRTVASLPASTSRRSPIVSLDKLVGMEARQAIQPDDMIFTDQVQSPLLVKRGEIITVVSQGGGVRVRTTARARQDGAKGELVQVETLETREPYDARVTGLREAAVFAAIGRPPTKSKEVIETWATAPRKPQPPTVIRLKSNSIETARR
jgi:flagella basal body P-ring formation protein FlgA